MDGRLKVCAFNNVNFGAFASVTAATCVDFSLDRTHGAIVDVLLVYEDPVPLLVYALDGSALLTQYSAIFLTGSRCLPLGLR